METIVSLANRQKVVTTLQAYGTSEGVRQSWDTRGRSGKSTREATSKFSVWKSLDKAGFKETGSRRQGIRTFTANKKTAPQSDGHVSNYHHRIDVSSDGSWRHTKGPVNTDMTVGRVHGNNLQQLDNHLTSGKYQTSFRNQGWGGGGGKWDDVAEAR